MKNDGKYLERLVQLIEKSLDPTAKVEHDVDLPVLTSNIGATRQCDIVITQGKPHRETVTIVEVQDRGSKPSRNDFGGWMEKLKEVGAQHLICVSREGFSASTVEKASQTGSTIRLIELKEIDKDLIPINFFTFSFTIDDFDITKASDMKFYATKEEFEKAGITDGKIELGHININKPMFSIDGTNLISTYQLVKDNFNRPEDLNDGKDHLKLPTNGDLYIFVNDDFIKAKFEIDFEWTFERINVPISLMSYEQNGHGTLAWVMEGVHHSKRGTWRIKVPFEQLDNDNFIIKNMELEVPNNHNST